MNRITSWFFDCTLTPVLYGVCVWSVSRTNIEVRITLDDTESGTIDRRELFELVTDYSDTRLCRYPDSRIVIEDTPEMNVLARKLKTDFKKYRIERVKRESTASEQISKYSMMINRERYFIDSFLIEPDLIFDKFSNENLIDPVYLDEQTIFPQTQSFLIGCHYLDTIKKPYSSGSIGIAAQRPIRDFFY